MATQKGGYFLKDGVTKVPSVTTVLGRFKESGGLIHWAWEQGKSGKDYREVRDSAADCGTMAHEAVEKWLQGEEFKWVYPLSDVTQRAQRAFAAFMEWAGQTQLKVTHTEVPLISEKHKFGGTLDAMLIQGKRSLGDWKTSNKVYSEYLVQVAAYGILWEENFPNEPIEGGFHLLRFDKEFGDFHHHWWGELETAKRQFLLLREAYELDKELRKRAA
jgi:hypothetical protein